jgi:acetylornithine/N-succinyldiaminopimelate aminotransferase
MTAQTLSLNPVLAQLGSYPMAGFEKIKAQLRASGRPVFDFGIGDPVEETPLFIREALLSSVSARSQYPTVSGQAALREAAAGYLKRRFGVAIDASTELLPTAGSKEAIFSLPLALFNASSARRRVVMPDPGYPVYEHGTQFAGGLSHKVVLKADRGFLLEPDDLPEAVLAQCAIFWVSYPHNPTGAVADRAYFERVAAASQRHGFVVASDECYVDLHFGPQRPPSILEVTHERAIAFHSCSKRSGMTGYRSGFMAGDARLISALKQLRPSVGTASPDFIQLAAAAAWADDAHAEERRKMFGAKREKVLAHFARRNLQAAWSQGTFYLWAQVPDGFSGHSYAARLLEEGIVVSPGAFFGAGERFIRVALVPSLAEIEQAIARWP